MLLALEGAVVAFVFFAWVLAALEREDGVGYTLVALSAILAAIVGYLLRQVARITISHYQLENDARERASMIETYIAMLEEADGKAVTQEDRHLVLQQIFRRSHTGLVREDGDGMPRMELTPRSGTQ